jgi:hypothetical protein
VSPGTLSDEAVLREAVQRGLLDPWRVDDLLENEVAPSLQRIEQLLEGQQLDGAPSGEVVGLLEEIARNTGDVVRPEVRENLPVEAEGTALEEIAEGQTGDASFSLEGTVFTAEVLARRRVRSVQSVRIIGPDNAVVPFSAEEDILKRSEAAGVVAMATSPGDFNQTVTQTNVEIAPGETATVLESDLDAAALWWAVGTNDQEFSRYQYQVDDEAIFDVAQFEPLGLYNDPFRFPQPLIGRGTLRTVVSRDSDATASAGYFIKHRFVPIAEHTADRLERSWEVV